MTAIYDLADRFVEQNARLDPLLATLRGITGHDTEMTDYSPDGVGARSDLHNRTLQELAALAPDGTADRIAAEVMREGLETALALEQFGESFRDLSVIFSPVQLVRMVFDVMPHETAADWDVVTARTEKVPAALASLRAGLAEGLRRGTRAARRQALACAGQAAVWSGTDEGHTEPFFARELKRLETSDVENRSLHDRLARAAGEATAAYAELARYLRDDYAPAAEERDPVGLERYRVRARASLGLDMDLAEAYAWGWDEVHRLEDQMRALGERILPSEPIEAVIDLMETDPARAIEGEGRFRHWLQELMDRTVTELDGTHFDIPDPIKRVEAMIAPPGGAAAMYYTGPSEDLSRPGRTWYPTRGRTRFPLWGEVSTAYHEGVPGHHLQVAQVRYMRDRLSRYQRSFTFVPGHGEGWALYAEHLMGELGYLENPDHELGMLRMQRFRAARVVVDIGMHLEMRIPHDETFHPGEVWNAALGREFMKQHGFFDDGFIASEVDRYLGRPAQAICYKLGERVWLDSREQVRRRQGVGFDLKAFHSRALGLGPMGLAQLQRELTTEQAGASAG